MAKKIAKDFGQGPAKNPPNMRTYYPDGTKIPTMEDSEKRWQEQMKSIPAKPKGAPMPPPPKGWRPGQRRYFA